MWYTLITKGKELINMLKTDNVKCLTCGDTLKEYDCIDIEIDSNRVCLLKVGSCSHCDKIYQWHEEYALAGYYDLEQIHIEYKNE